MPDTAIRIEHWTWTKVVTDKDVCVATDASHQFAATVEPSPTEVRETVKATFALENPLAFTRSERYGRSEGQKVLPTKLVVEFGSENGGEWKILGHGGVQVIAHNLLKSGGLGMLADVHPTWIPDTLRNLAAGAGLAWVVSEYPR